MLGHHMVAFVGFVISPWFRRAPRREPQEALAEVVIGMLATSLHVDSQFSSVDIKI